jgi:hypothetical protein
MQQAADDLYQAQRIDRAEWQRRLADMSEQRTRPRWGADSMKFCRTLLIGTVVNRGSQRCLCVRYGGTTSWTKTSAPSGRTGAGESARPLCFVA